MFFYLPFSSNLRRLRLVLPFKIQFNACFKALKKHKLLSWKESIAYNYLTILLWSYVSLTFPSISDRLEEPKQGNPPEVFYKGKLVSEDLASSIIEYDSIVGQCGSLFERPITIMELGGGYGRTAYVFLTLNQNMRYILVDIPPSLWICQKYLSSIFTSKAIFQFRHFESYEEIRDEYEQSDLIFMTPNQLELIPTKSVDLFINISSLHEMRLNQVSYYLKEIDRLSKGFFYFKQWKKSVIPFENTVISESYYPIPEGWTEVFRRNCLYPPLFFEALYRISAKSPSESSNHK